ncbi:hypothetical protein ATCC53582_02107 [Novacetimonas hansenii]|nr:hypothetical protein ATCC53582_00384 [Novacetimonas hansenii]CUW46820.1 hypothetical protein ATCC53582_00918 [Novacetimonas hansenii]CUW47692.1 hypothetical protein ATCC53582_01811 [Novacetimonas hansenii]CUW47981.1 hypothetical protein ATCC53582_02107 [Novacetimonas hansenii]
MLAAFCCVCLGGHGGRRLDWVTDRLAETLLMYFFKICVEDVSKLYAGFSCLWLRLGDCLFVYVSLRHVDEPESLILAQSERWRHA